MAEEPTPSLEATLDGMARSAKKAANLRGYFQDVTVSDPAFVSGRGRARQSRAEAREFQIVNGKIAQLYKTLAVFDSDRSFIDQVESHLKGGEWTYSHWKSWFNGELNYMAHPQGDGRELRVVYEGDRPLGSGNFIDYLQIEAAPVLGGVALDVDLRGRAVKLIGPEVFRGLACVRLEYGSAVPNHPRMYLTGTTLVCPQRDYRVVFSEETRSMAGEVHFKTKRIVAEFGHYNDVWMPTVVHHESTKVFGANRSATQQGTFRVVDLQVGNVSKNDTAFQPLFSPDISIIRGATNTWETVGGDTKLLEQSLSEGDYSSLIPSGALGEGTVIADMGSLAVGLSPSTGRFRKGPSARMNIFLSVLTLSLAMVFLKSLSKLLPHSAD